MNDRRQIYFMNRISLPAENHEQIERFKRACKKHIGAFPSMSSWAHISFPSYSFYLNDSRDVFSYIDYYQIIESYLKMMPAIELKIIGFDILKHGPLRTIYAKLSLDSITITWFNRVAQIFDPKAKINPHITIAKAIPTSSFNILWPYFEKIEFNDSFNVRSITVLHKLSNERGAYKPFREISLRKGN